MFTLTNIYICDFLTIIASGIIHPRLIPIEKIINELREVASYLLQETHFSCSFRMAEI